MIPDRAPRDLQNIERCLLDRPREEPTSALRARIMNQVRRELPPGHGTIASRERWQYAAAIAAALLIGSNLANIGASLTSVVADTRLRSDAPRATSASFLELSPDLSVSEASRIARLAQAIDDLPCVPSPKTFPRQQGTLNRNGQIIVTDEHF
jgi:hypothetical protein